MIWNPSYLCCYILSVVMIAIHDLLVKSDGIGLIVRFWLMVDPWVEGRRLYVPNR